MNAQNKKIVTDFIEVIWNNNQFEQIDHFITPDFIDYSLPPSFSPDREGMIAWIVATGKSFQHKTIIEDIVSEQNKVMLKISMQLKHIGTWRDIAPTYMEITTVGYRYYKISAGKIIEHRCLLDGNSIENQLKQSAHGCKIKR
jgi:hypothetical protein